MAQTPEGRVKKFVKKILDDLSIYYFMPATYGFGRSGVPDFVCCFDGLFVGIECKAGDNQPTALQERELTKIRTAGGLTFVVRETNLDILRGQLTCIKGTKPSVTS